MEWHFLILKGISSHTYKTGGLWVIIPHMITSFSSTKRRCTHRYRRRSHRVSSRQWGFLMIPSFHTVKMTWTFLKNSFSLFFIIIYCVWALVSMLRGNTPPSVIWTCWIWLIIVVSWQYALRNAQTVRTLAAMPLRLIYKWEFSKSRTVRFWHPFSESAYSFSSDVALPRRAPSVARRRCAFYRPARARPKHARGPR